MVPRKRIFHCDVRDCTYPTVPPRAHGNHSHVLECFPRFRSGDGRQEGNRASITVIFPRHQPIVFQATSRYELLSKALQHHSRLTKLAAMGKGVDRHLLGLSLVARKSEHIPLFSDDYFLKSQEWKLSTSGLSAGLYFRGTGRVLRTCRRSYSKNLYWNSFGSPYKDGYGINCKFGDLDAYTLLTTTFRPDRTHLNEILYRVETQRPGNVLQ